MAITWGWNSESTAFRASWMRRRISANSGRPAHIYGKVTLSDVLGAVADNSWEESSKQYLNATLKNTRLGYAVNALDNHIKTKLTPTIVDHMSKACGKTFTPGQTQEVSREFQRFMAILIDASQKRLDPLRKFCDSVGQVSDSTPEQGLALLNHLAGLSRISPAAEFKLADGTKLDFSAEMKKLFADPRTFGAPLENLPKNVQQAANCRAPALHVPGDAERLLGDQQSKPKRRLDRRAAQGD